MYIKIFLQITIASIQNSNKIKNVQRYIKYMEKDKIAKKHEICIIKLKNNVSLFLR